MKTFNHKSYTTVDAKRFAQLEKAGLVKGLSVELLDNGDRKIWQSEVLTVPTTMEELASVTGSMVEVKLGEDTVEVPEPIFDFIVGRKLRSNQSMQKRFAKNASIDPMVLLQAVNAKGTDEEKQQAAAAMVSLDALRKWAKGFDEVRASELM